MPYKIPRSETYLFRILDHFGFIVILNHLEGTLFVSNSGRANLNARHWVSSVLKHLGWMQERVGGTRAAARPSACCPATPHVLNRTQVT